MGDTMLNYLECKGEGGLGGGDYLRIEMPVQEYHLIEILEVETYTTNWKRSQQNVLLVRSSLHLS
jgi:hypothetical protein